MALPNLRSIFASSRTSDEERQLSRNTFYKFAAFVTSCIVISVLASNNNGDRHAATTVAAAAAAGGVMALSHQTAGSALNSLASSGAR